MRASPPVVYAPKTTQPPVLSDRFKASRKAFSLIEVLLALVIFAMAAGVLMASFVNALLARERGAQDARWEDDIRLVRMQLLLEPIREDAETGGEVTTLHHGEASWRALIEPTQVVDLFAVQFQIEFSSPPEDSPGSFVETLFLLRPTWSEADERSDLLQDKRDALLDSRRFGSF